ncbi:hypothetical protein SAMN04490357_0076 [Streptomyces misionensis]|uniref:Uncharacterized protein n=1 Tax=Streptomyces misionensis TaxID=67331 RepID=A0A1H4IA35_9ACTN|nr:hypothetical protein [Streptomyces misionensis]SEB30790.1 hypothetical protein SAMN04490357_0076 [Streptomyces misionensis]
MLYLKAAYAEATAAASARAVPGLLDQADEHATQLGAATNVMWTAFSAANVALYRLAAHVQLGKVRGEQYAETARELVGPGGTLFSTPQLPPPAGSGTRGVPVVGGERPGPSSACRPDVTRRGSRRGTAGRPASAGRTPRRVAPS